METARICVEDRRLWIGNLDPRVTDPFLKRKNNYIAFDDFNLHIHSFLYRYQLLKLVQKHGNIEKFDLIFHRSGPQAGLPRGYAFVTYTKKKDAETAKNLLNGSLVGQKKIVVTSAHSVNNEEVEKPKEEIFIPALAMSKESSKTDRVSQIQAIEEKLKLMEKKKEDELKINESVATKPPVIVQYQFNKSQTTNSSTSASNFKYRQNFRKKDGYSKPYSKSKTGR
ncbi:hypothetical protein JTB14_010078 [Gonioctena quinquepunctata]|nr:hypothetical protein JTB14_010078 [Gonioctena quinquepunctata]